MPSNLPTSQLAYPTHIIPLPLPCPSQTVNAENACPAKNRATAAMAPGTNIGNPSTTCSAYSIQPGAPREQEKIRLRRTTSFTQQKQQEGIINADREKHHRLRQPKEAAAGTPSGTNREAINKQRPNNKRKPWNGANPACIKGRRRKTNGLLCRLSGKNLYLSGRIGTTSPDMALCPAFISAPGKGP